MTRLLTVSVILLLGACSTDISGDSRYPTDYVVGGVYEVKQPLIALRDRTLLDFLGQLPYSLYDEKKVPPSIARGRPLIAPGTLVRVTQLRRDRGSLGETYYWVSGAFVSGPLAGEPVELVFISIAREPPLVNTNMLRLVTEP